MNERLTKLLHKGLVFPVSLHGDGGHNDEVEYKKLVVSRSITNPLDTQLIDPNKAVIEPIGYPESGFQKIKVICCFFGQKRIVAE